MSELETLGVGIIVGACLVGFAIVIWWSIELRIEKEVNEAKREMREYVRNREGL